jgi:hypothetical protein
MRICNAGVQTLHGSMVSLQGSFVGLHGSRVNLHGYRVSLHGSGVSLHGSFVSLYGSIVSSLQLPAFHHDADPDPASLNDIDPCGPGSALLSFLLICFVTYKTIF